MKCKCTKGFEIEMYDGDGFSLDEMMDIEEGTVWEVSDDEYRIVGDKDTVHLDLVDDRIYSWLEISQYTFQHNFTILGDDNANEN